MKTMLNPISFLFLGMLLIVIVICGLVLGLLVDLFVGLIDIVKSVRNRNRYEKFLKENDHGN